MAVGYDDPARPVVQPDRLVAQVDEAAVDLAQLVVVRRHPDPVRPAALAAQHRHVAVAADPDRVEAGGQQPRLGPAAHVALGHLVEGREEVGQRRVAEPVPGQVGVQPGQERLVAQPGGELAQRGVALRVGDHVEVVGRRVNVGHVLGRRRDRMGRAALVGVEGRRLAADLSSDQGTRLAGGVGSDPVAHVVGERLLQPGVLPPGHRDQVAEPHVRHLVGDGRGAAGALQVGEPAARQVLVAVGHAPGRLQRAPVLARHERLVEGVERVGLGEELGVVVEAGDGRRLEAVEVAVELGRQRAPGMPAERDAGVLPGPRVPRPGADDEHRGRDRRRGREPPAPVLVAQRPAVGQHRPGRVGGDRELDRRLEIVLVEAGEDALGDVHADVRRHVDLAVGRVGERVHAVAVGHVGQPRLDHHLVGRRPVR